MSSWGSQAGPWPGKWSESWCQGIERAFGSVGRDTAREEWGFVPFVLPASFPEK